MLNGWPASSRMVHMARDVDTSAGPLRKGTLLLMLHESSAPSHTDSPDDVFTVWAHGQELVVRRADIE